VSDGLFPLGDDLSDEEEVEKVDVKKSVQKMLDREEKYRKKNEKKKEDYRKLVKQRRKEEQQQKQDNGDSDAEEEDVDNEDMEDVDNEDGQEVGTKRKMREEEDGENSGVKKAKTELGVSEAVTNGKESKKEKEKKRKQEMKRRKRERQLAEKEREKELAARQDRILEQDMEVAARLGGGDQSDVPKLKKEKKKNKKKSVDEGAVSKTPKVVNGPAARVPAVDNLEAVLSKKKKKKKSKKERQETADATPPKQDVSAKQQTSPEKKMEKKEKLAVVETVSNIEGKESISKSEKKKKKREKAALEGSSVVTKIASPQKAPVVPSSPADEKQKGGSSGKLFDELDDWDAPLLPGEQEIIIPNKKYKGAAKLTPAAQSPDVTEHSPKSKKKKEKKNKEKKDNAADNPFSELSASPVAKLPVSPTSSGEVKSPPATPKGFPGFSSPTVSTPNLAKSHTAVFLKKALSKSVTPKVKKSGSKAAKMEEIERSASEPRLKKVNFVLTRNKSQVKT
jgi:hypothetical protein